jgi:hypothetical protein
MKKGLILFILAAVVGLSGVANATLTTIGTATYGSNAYNLIYEGDINGTGLIWLDYTKSAAYWDTQRTWANGLNGAGVLVYNLNSGISVDWTGGVWRLPTTVDGAFVEGFDGTTTGGYNVKTSEMGHLYFESLGNNARRNTDGTWNDPASFVLKKGDFQHLTGIQYWSDTQRDDTATAWAFYINKSSGGVWGRQIVDAEVYSYYALAVHPAGVAQSSPVPIPAAVWLLGSGLAGLGLLRKRLGDFPPT